MVIYADTSVLVSLYAQDANSAAAQQLATTLTRPLAWTPLQQHETRNAFRLAAFRKHITTGQCQAVLHTIHQDHIAGILVDPPVPWPDVFAHAESLSTAHAAHLGTRSADILHVAIALTLGLDHFLSFDHRQLSLAHHAGLNVNPP